MTNRAPDVLLLTPPLMDAVEFPELGVPQLLAWLRHNQVSAAQIDLNMELLTGFLSAEVWRSKVLARLAATDRRMRGDGLEQMLPTRLPTTTQDGIEAVRRWIEKAVEVLNLGVRDYSITSLCNVAAKPHEVYDAFYQQWVFSARTPPRVVGLSLISPSQLAPAIRLAAAVKHAWPDTFLVVGGPWVIAAERILATFLEAVPQIDAAVLRRGEGPLLALVQTLLAAAPGSVPDLSTVPNLLFRGNEGLVRTSIQPATPLRVLPPPDFDGLHLQTYLASILPVQTNSRCYWGECLFCYHDSPHTSAGERSPEQVVGDIQHLVRTTGISTYFLADCATPFPWMGRFAELLQAGSVPVSWAALCRAETCITPELCHALRRSGCAVLMIGLETVSQAGLVRIRKGITPADVEHAARCCAEAGIRVHLFLLDFPTNSLADLRATMEFVLGISDCVEDFTVQRFQLSMLSRLYDMPDLLGISPLSRQGDTLDVFDLPYTAQDQTSKEEFLAVASEYRRRFNLKKGRVGSPFVVASSERSDSCGPP